MRRAVFGVWVLGAVWLAPAVWAVMDDDVGRSPWDAGSPRPEAEALLAKLRSTFPAVPVDISSEMLVMNAAGDIERRVRVDLFLNWSAAEPYARYIIRDAFGAPLEELSVRWRADGTRTCRYQKGDPMAEAPLPDLSDAVQGTDISWLDLTLAYLRWRGGKTVGAESVRSRFCFIVDVEAPKEDAERYAGVRLWIDPQIGLLLQAAAYDHEGNLAKLLEVKSFKKIRDVWIIKDIDVQSYPARHRTRLRVISAGPAGAKQGESATVRPSGD
jgi:hypothetical protein